MQSLLRQIQLWSSAQRSCPKRALPKWLPMLVGPMADKRFTRKFIRNNVNVEWKADNSKIKSDLGIQFRPLQNTMEDAFQVLVDNKMV